MQIQLEYHIAGLKSLESDEHAEVDNSTDMDMANDESNKSNADDTNGNHLNEAAHSDTFEQFKNLIQETSSLGDIINESAKLMNMLTLGCDKGSIDISGKYKSRSERWFGSKKFPNKDSHGGTIVQDKRLVRLCRDSIIMLRIKKGGCEMLLEYRALAFFIKYYGKWFVSIPEEFCWNMGNVSTIPKGRVLARLLKSHGDSYEEVKLEAGGEWAPNHVFTSVKFDEIVSVGDELVDMWQSR